MAFMLRNVINKTVMAFIKYLLGILYLYAVVKNLLWFIAPLYEREEYTSLTIWFEDTWAPYRERLLWMASRVQPWKR